MSADERFRSALERLLVLHLPQINLERVRALVSDIGAALEDPDRIREFDGIVSRARGLTS